MKWHPAWTINGANGVKLVAERWPLTSVLIGASRAEQLEENVQALNNLTFSTEELAQIDQHIADGELNLWQASSDK
ncbi:aldo/keto reductase [Escherichia coli]